jgi:hypothetical protein
LTTIYAIIRRCTREVSQFIPELFKHAMNLLDIIAIWRLQICKTQRVSYLPIIAKF